MLRPAMPNDPRGLALAYAYGRHVPPDVLAGHAELHPEIAAWHPGA
jgi:hypothetical protein